MASREARTIKSVSFSQVDAYERELFDYALTASSGKFGPYVKRLIERDRAGNTAGQTQAVPAVLKTQNSATPEKGARKTALAFL